MGDRLLQNYEEARRLGGKKAEMRLAILTRMSLLRAKQEPDTAENIAIFSRAMTEIGKEFMLKRHAS